MTGLGTRLRALGGAARRHWKRSLGAVVAIAVVAASAWWLAGWWRGSPKPLGQTVPVALPGANAPAGMRVGVVTSQTEEEGQGAHWSSSAQGAAVARWRLAKGGADVALVPVSDQGSDEGARRAVDELAAQRVSAIIAVTSGSHVDALLGAAREAGIPVVLPFETADGRSTDGAWFAGPSASDWKGLARDQGRALGCRSYKLVEGARVFDGVADAEDVAVSYTQTPAPMRHEEDIARLVADSALGTAQSGQSGEPGGQDTCVLVDSEPLFMARTVFQLRARGVLSPVFAGPQASSPVFLAELERLGVNPDSVRTIAPQSPAVSAATSTAVLGASASAFLEAAAQMRTDPGAAQSQGQSAPAPLDDAQAASPLVHDAFLAVVKAGAAAKSAEPADVRAALASVVLSAAEGAVAQDSESFGSSPYWSCAAVELTGLGPRLVWAAAEG